MAKHNYPFAIFPPEYRFFQEQFRTAAQRLAAKLSDLKLPKNSVSPFIESYLSSNLNNLEGSIQRNSFLLAWALNSYFSRLQEITLVDYGGGSGLLSLFAKELGIGRVVYVDIYDVCCRDAKYIGNALRVKADHYVNGDIDSLLSYLSCKKIECDTVVSFDTLEHIYNINDFLEKIIKVSIGPLTLALASSANPLNPLISRRLMKLQKKMEFEGKIKKGGEDPRDTNVAYLPLRREIINNLSLTLSNDEADTLAQKTRGMREEDIFRAVKFYLTRKELPLEPGHPTNTCDPFTGNWCERLMNPYDLAKELSKRGFETRVFGGYYGSGCKGPKLKIFARLFANMAITLIGNLGIRISPFYCIVATRKSNVVSF